MRSVGSTSDRFRDKFPRSHARASKRPMRNATTGTIFILAATVLLPPRSATGDQPSPRCESVSGKLEEDPGGASCPPDHPNCFMGAIHGKKLEATTPFYGEGSVAAPPASPGWFAYSGVTTY